MPNKKTKSKRKSAIWFWTITFSIFAITTSLGFVSYFTISNYINRSNQPTPLEDIIKITSLGKIEITDEDEKYNIIFDKIIEINNLQDSNLLKSDVTITILDNELGASVEAKIKDDQKFSGTIMISFVLV